MTLCDLNHLEKLIRRSCIERHNAKVDLGKAILGKRTREKGIPIVILSNLLVLVRQHVDLMSDDTAHSRHKSAVYSEDFVSAG